MLEFGRMYFGGFPMKRVVLGTIVFCISSATYGACNETIPGIVGVQVNSQSLMARMNGASGGDVIRAQREIAVSTNLMTKLRPAVVAKMKEGCLSVHPIEQSANPRDVEVVVSVETFDSKETGAQVLLRAGTMANDMFARGFNDGMGRYYQAQNIREAGDNITDGTFIIQRLKLNAELVCGKKIHEISVSGILGDDASSSAVRKLVSAVREKILDGCGIDPTVAQKFKEVEVVLSPSSPVVEVSRSDEQPKQEERAISPGNQNPVEAIGNFFKGIFGGGQAPLQTQ